LGSNGYSITKGSKVMNIELSKEELKLVIRAIGNRCQDLATKEFDLYLKGQSSKILENNLESIRILHNKLKGAK
jgi:hypothetical protein